jgi:hypothetical protein
VACAEVLSPTWGVVEQILAVHKIVILDGMPSIARIDDTKPGIFDVYFYLEEQHYFLVIVVESNNNLLVIAGSYVEANINVYLMINSNLLEPDAITARIGIQPTRTKKKGEPRTPRSSLLWETNYWIFEPQKDVPDELERKLSFFLAQLENVATSIFNLSEECDISINIIYKGYQEWMGGWHLDRQIISRILSLGADIDLDIYARGPDLPNLS